MDPRLATLPTHDPRYVQPRNRPRGKKGQVNYLCPLGCADAKRVNRHGYCRHLAGFITLPDGLQPGKKPPVGSTFEVREKIDVDKERVGEIIDQIDKADILVPMEGESWRVYRRNGRYPILDSNECKHREKFPEIEDDDDLYTEDLPIETDAESDKLAADYVAKQEEAEKKRQEKLENQRVKYMGKASKRTPVNDDEPKS